MKTRRPTLVAATAAGILTVAMLLAPGAGASAPPADNNLAAAAVAVENADVPGTAWAVHPKTDTLRITADSTVDAAELARLRTATARYGDNVVIERTQGTLRPYVSGGSTVYSSGWRCIAGFNVHSGSTYYFLTAGHCTDGATSWWADSARTVYIGPAVGTSFPGNDYGLVRYDNPAVPHPSEIRNANGFVTEITQAGNPTAGQPVCTTNDQTTTVHCAQIQATNATVNYGDGNIVYGMIQTNLCAEPGWSGSPLFSGTTALGIMSGGSGNCSSGGTTFFQPVVEALNAYGVTV